MTSIQVKRRLVVALLLSAGLNLFFVGGIAYRASVFGLDPDTSARPLPPSMGWLVDDLEPTRRQELREGLRERGMEGRAARAAMVRAQREVNRLMATEPFDASALEAAFSTLREAADAYQSTAHAQTVAALSKLSAEERLAALKFLERRGPRERGGDGPRGNRPDGGTPHPGGRPGPDAHPQ